MRFPIYLGLVTALIPGCGDDTGGTNVDAPPDHPPPRVISGGGIGDGPINGVANVYVIDDATRAPISGATVRVGTVDGTTDATGLFVAEGVTGPQTVIVKASAHRSDMWVGANGANMTFNMEAATESVPAAATIAGTIDLSSITLATNHFRVATVFYSGVDDLGDPANEIATADNANVCFVPNATACTYSIKTRTGKVALMAAIFDHDTKGTASDTDDTQTLIGWAVKTGLTVTGGVDQSGITMTLVDVGMLNTVTVDFGTVPTGFTAAGALVGIDIGADGVLQLPLFRTPANTTLLVPKLAAFAGSTYRLTAIANTGASATAAESIVLRRKLTGTTLMAGTWLAAPTSTMASRTGVSYAPVSGATIHSIEFKQGTAGLLNISMFDASTSQLTIPDLVALPQGALEVDINAIGAPGLDVNNFTLDDEKDKLAMVSSQPVPLN